MAEITMLEAIREALFEEMERDPTVVALGEDIGVYGGAFKVTEGLLARFGTERVMDTPISETAIVGAAGPPRAVGRRGARRAVPFGESGDVFRAHAGAEGGLSFDAGRCQGSVEVRYSR